MALVWLGEDVRVHLFVDLRYRLSAKLIKDFVGTETECELWEVVCCVTVLCVHSLLSDITSGKNFLGGGGRVSIYVDRERRIEPSSKRASPFGKRGFTWFTSTDIPRFLRT
jgi:hypothetical protein